MIIRLLRHPVMVYGQCLYNGRYMITRLLRHPVMVYGQCFVRLGIDAKK